LVAPPEEAGWPFRFYEASDKPLDQSLANVNNVADWPQAAQLATDLWERGGEEPVDGVFTVTPAFLADVLGVLGPVEVPEYGETVTAESLIERFDLHTELVEEGQETNVERKAFVAALTEVVVVACSTPPLPSGGRWRASQHPRSTLPPHRPWPTAVESPRKCRASRPPSIFMPSGIPSTRQRGRRRFRASARRSRFSRWRAGTRSTSIVSSGTPLSLATWLPNTR
jgi:hypothetical protein